MTRYWTMHAEAITHWHRLGWPAVVNVKAFIKVMEFNDSQFIVMATRQGLVKKTNLMAFSKPRRDGIYAIKLNDGDDLIEARLSDGANDIILGTQMGMAIRFQETEVREMGRNTMGVRGINLGKDDAVIGMVVVKREGTLLAVSELGFGKRTDIREYRVSHRSGKGIKTFKVSDKTGALVSIMEVVDDDDLMLITDKGVVLRIHVGNIKSIGRNTMGVRVMRLDSGAKVSDVARIVKTDDEDEAGEDEDSGEE